MPATPVRNTREKTDNAIKVWDRAVRLFHWSLVVLVAAGSVTGYIAPENWMGLHAAVGYAIAALLVFRVVWSIFGGEYARLANFAYGARAVGEHLRGLVLLRPPHYLGHTPLGAIMIFTLVAMVGVLVVSGLMVLGGEEHQGPLAGLIGYNLGYASKAVHGTVTVVLLVMVALHVAGVVIESLLMRENLVSAMITGWKRLPADAPRPCPRKSRPRAAGIAFGLITVLLGGAFYGASVLRVPDPRLTSLNDSYAAECGDCHEPFHPSLLPAKSWAAIMAHLEQHFGEDASLDSDTTQSIADFLETNSAEAWDSEVANRFRTVSPEAPLRITATPYWIAKHAGIAESRFTAAPVLSKANCGACHGDSASGRFDDQNILWPVVKSASVPKSGARHNE